MGGMVTLWFMRPSPDRAVWVLCLVFLGKTLYSHSARLSTVGTGAINAGGNPVMD